MKWDWETKNIISSKNVLNFLQFTIIDYCLHQKSPLISSFSDICICLQIDLSICYHFVAPLISKQTTRFRKSIPAEQRLVVALGYLATGETKQSLSFDYRIGKATTSKIFAETSEAIFQTLKDPFLKTPNCQKDWLSTSKGFEDKWDFPHFLGSLDWKQLRSISHKIKNFLHSNQSKCRKCRGVHISVLSTSYVYISTFNR